MRCQSVQALWPSAPPLHQVVATATIDEPPTLYTGGSDGAIVWWKLSSSSASQKEVWPMAMLCGHAATVADLEICTLGKDYEVAESFSDQSLVYESGEALMSASVDGVLCMWSSLNGHCMRRRKMPPWIGRPFVLLSLPRCRRYVCIACTCANTGQGQNSYTGKCKEETIETEGRFKRTSKDAVVIVDSTTLNILQVIFHGILSIGPVKSMVIVPDMILQSTSQSVIMSDLFGRIQLFSINEEKALASKTCNNMGKGDLSCSVSMGSMDAIPDGAEEVSIAASGRLLLMVFRNQWVIKSTIDGSVAIDESCIHSFLCRKDSSGHSFLAGGMFLTISEDHKFKAEHTNGNIVENFVIWNNQGAAIIYALVHSEHSSYANSLFLIPPISSFHEGDICIKFSHMCGNLIRIESVIADFELPLFRETHVTIWSPPYSSLRPLQNWGHLDVKSEGGMPNITSDEHCIASFLGKGGLWGEWFKTTYLCYSGGNHDYNGKNNGDALKGKPNKDKKVESGDGDEHLWCLGSPTKSVEHLEGNDAIVLDRSKIVTSAMILSGSSTAPFALVYGYCSGEIRLLNLETLGPKHDTGESKLQPENDSSMVLRSFKGHTGPILCLAAHSMLTLPREQGSRRVLVSGSMDCTVRIWDLEGGDTLAVMHQHVAPVRQILLPPPCTQRPWADCFLTVGDDACVALSSFETLRVERMFPGHPSYPKMVAWDGERGYIACLCLQFTDHSGHNDVLYIWDVKSGARERILRGGAVHSMFDHFFRCIRINATASNILGGSTSASSLLLDMDEDSNHSHTATSKLEEGRNLAPAGSKSLTVAASSVELTMNAKKTGGNLEKFSSKVVQALSQGVKAASAVSSLGDPVANSSIDKSFSQHFLQNMQIPINGVCPFPGVAALQFDLFSLMAPDLRHLSTSRKLEKKNHQRGLSEGALGRSDIGSPNPRKNTGNSVVGITDSAQHPNWPEEKAWLGTVGGRLLRLSLSFLHLWGADDQLDKLLAKEMDISKPEHLWIAAGLHGDRGSLTLLFPGWRAKFELWKSSSEFCAMRSLTMVSLAQRMIILSRPPSAASSALASFYTRSFAEKFLDLKPPSLELYACFWQDPSEHVRMAARSLFHCAATRAIPKILRCERSVSPSISFIYRSDTEIQSVNKDGGMSSNDDSESKLDLSQRQSSQLQLSEISSWLDSHQTQDWTSMIGGTSQDARASRIIVGAALAVWYPSLVKPDLAVTVAPQIVKLVMAVNDRHSATAAELLAEGMESTWKSLIASEIPHLIADVFLLIECLSGGASTNKGPIQNPALAMTIRDALTGTLLPSLAMADVPGFLHVVDNQIWTTGSDSPVHLVSLMTLVRIIRGAPKAMAPYLDKVIDYILQTIDTGNSVMRKFCLQSSMAALKEMVRVFPMIALNESSAKLAVGDAAGDNCTLAIQVYDLQSVTKLKVLDASGPPGLPSLLAGDQAMTTTGGISALSFSPDGEGLVAFSQHGLMIRWWSLGAAWWEKLSRNMVPVQCTKLILVPPWAGFSPTSARASIMGSILGCNKPNESQSHDRGTTEEICAKVTAQNFDLSYRLEWKPGKNVVLLQHGQELGTFQL